MPRSPFHEPRADRPPRAAELARAVRRTVLGAIALASSLHGALVVWALFTALSSREREPAALVAALTTPLLAVAAARRALRSAHPTTASLGWSALGGALNVPLAMLVLGVVCMREQLVESFENLLLVPLMLFSGTILVSPIALAAGVLFGVAFMPLIAPSSVEIAAPDHLAVARVRVRAGLWAACVGSLGAALSVALECGGAMFAAASLIIGGTALAIVGARSERTTRAWLARVRRGDVDGWRIVARDELDIDDLDLLPIGTDPTPEHLLMRIADAGDGAYREARTRIAWARVSAS
ncbi:MAG: hypothetical protein M3Y87_23855 [Myxococcota bacterium]|nr:hypothetical protein [Myxococcota bacterium]